MTTTVQNGSTVTLHYKGTLNDGSEFDNTHQREPLTTKTGEGNLIPGFEAALVGMSEGETKTFTIECADAYGQPRGKDSDCQRTLPRGLPPTRGDDYPIDVRAGSSCYGHRDRDH